jgi:hypothetical protein
VWGLFCNDSAPREEIMSSCGLSRQEAELVQRLHGAPRKLAAAS